MSKKQKEPLHSTEVTQLISKMAKYPIYFLKVSLP